MFVADDWTEFQVQDFINKPEQSGSLIGREAMELLVLGALGANLFRELALAQESTVWEPVLDVVLTEAWLLNAKDVVFEKLLPVCIQILGRALISTPLHRFRPSPLPGGTQPVLCFAKRKRV